MEPIDTHLAIDRTLCGEPVDISEGRARVLLTTTQAMAVDERGLVHGGFVFGAADYAAMLAVNDPHVVLGGADVRFLKPVVVGELVEAVAIVEEQKGHKHQVQVAVRRPGSQVDGSDAEDVFTGRFTCFVLPEHVLDGK
jgi:acyl-coenzyme A thioesterase PaaI-like protein